MQTRVSSLKIGRVAKASGTGIETIRFYERSGLIDEPPRRASGYREYPQETVARLKFIKRAKELGFSLKEISGLLALSKSGKGSCGTVRKRAQAKQEQIAGMIADLKSIHTALGEFVSSCEKRNPADACPFLKRFHEES